MKQLIIMMATIMLGIGIGGIIMGFQDTADDLKAAGVEKAMTIVEEPAES